MRRRIQALAIERGIPPAKIANLMKGRTTVCHVAQFCEEYQVNADWLMAGDLRGLLDTVKRQKEAQVNPVIRDAQTREFVRLMGKVDPRLYPELLARIREAVEGETRARSFSDFPLAFPAAFPRANRERPRLRRARSRPRGNPTRATRSGRKSLRCPARRLLQDW